MITHAKYEFTRVDITDDDAKEFDSHGTWEMRIITARDAYAVLLEMGDEIIKGHQFVPLPAFDDEDASWSLLKRPLGIFLSKPKVCLPSSNDEPLANGH